MDKNFLLDAASNKPDLFSAIINFNCRLLYEVVFQLVQEMNSLAEGIPGFNKEATGNAALNAVSLKADRLIETGRSFWDFSDETRRLALVDPETLHKTQLIFGTAVHAEALSRALLRSEVLQLEDLLGKDVYQYGLDRGRFQLGTVRQFFLARDTDLPLVLRIQWHGRLALKICMSAWPEPLQETFESQLKDIRIPDEIESALPTEFDPNVIYGVWFGLKKILLREVAPEWTSYFD